MKLFQLILLTAVAFFGPRTFAASGCVVERKTSMYCSGSVSTPDGVQGISVLAQALNDCDIIVYIGGRPQTGMVSIEKRPWKSQRTSGYRWEVTSARPAQNHTQINFYDTSTFQRGSGLTSADVTFSKNWWNSESDLSVAADFQTQPIELTCAPALSYVNPR